MEEMRTWMETEGLLYSQGTLIGKAVGYAYTRWENMTHVLEDGRLLLDNNLAENEIRPITLGRKNYLFCGNHEAAGNMCVVTSLLATCRYPTRPIALAHTYGRVGPQIRLHKATHRLGSMF